MPKESSSKVPKNAFKNMTYEKQIPNFLKSYYDQQEEKAVSIEDKHKVEVKSETELEEDTRPVKEDELPVIVSQDGKEVVASANEEMEKSKKPEKKAKGI